MRGVVGVMSCLLMGWRHESNGDRAQLIVQRAQCRKDDHECDKYGIAAVALGLGAVLQLSRVAHPQN